MVVFSFFDQLWIYVMPIDHGNKKPWALALERNATRENLDKIAKKVYKMAQEGKMDCIKEIGDRLDGKAVQALQTEHTAYTIMLPNGEDTNADTSTSEQLETEVVSAESLGLPGSRHGKH